MEQKGTTAGWKNSFPYDKLISFLVRSVTQPERCIVLGGTWRVPVAVGLQSKTFIVDQKEEGVYNEASFAREYESIWSGTVEDAFFNSEMIDRARILNQPENEATERIKNGYYIVSVDVGRKSCQTVASIINVSPQPITGDMKKLVNIYTSNAEHFEDQAIFLKKLFYRYKAKRMIIDANGIGAGLVDFMVKQQVDPISGNTLPDFGVYGGTYEGADTEFKKFQTKNCQFDALYLIKANAPINTEAHANVQTQLSSGRLKLLIDEKIAKQRLLGTKVGQAMTPNERADYLRPFTLTSILKEEIMNLRQENEGINIILKQANNTIGKDKFSSLEYGLYYIKQEEENKKRKKFSAKDWNFFN